MSSFLRGVTSLEGWSLSVEDDHMRQDLVGHGYVLDAVSMMETSPRFPSQQSHHLVYQYGHPKQRSTRRYVQYYNVL